MEFEELEYGVVAVGSATLDLVTPWGPQLAFRGTTEASIADLFEHPLERADIVPNVVFTRPVHEAVVTTAEHQITLRYRSTSSRFHLQSPVRVEGDYFLDEVVLRPVKPPEPCDQVVVDIHCTGRKLGFLGGRPNQDSRLSFSHGLRVVDGQHEMYLRETGDRKWTDHVHWNNVATFTYVGPLGGLAEEFDDYLWKAQVVIGSAIGCSMSPFALVGRGPDHRWYWARFQRPRRPMVRPLLARPLGREPSYMAGDDVRSWIEAAMSAWDEHDPKLGLEIALLYNENGPDQPEPEMRCRGPMIAFERLLAGQRRVLGLDPQSKLSSSLAEVSKRLPWRPFTDGPDGEINWLHRFRVRLAHLGDLLDERENTQKEFQRLVWAEGWLHTCFYRLAAAILGVDVYIVDRAARGLPRRKASEGGFAPPPFVP